ncbi:lipocalin-like domain-containing protein [Ancylobacter sp. Lp-2]|uniref:lipocalin-like domain-containing protein n=1 Tax=Ancylobacter sp. Lp-2 TaxID=2881339 RepID=UPI001E56EB91|nr:lipocalin-like domain-containing protein [Ancylobacter sp. Lp-2]MCB4771118.1 lipocalin-like domain-containing protein [Ancylobacter sp. Lp-2]
MREADLLGAWILRSFRFEEVATGRQWEPFGPNPAGTILLHPGGRFFALITPTGRPSPVTEAEQAAAFRDLVAYSGTYRIEAPDRLVTRVDISWFPRWIGTEQLRHCTLDGDDLELVSAPLDMPRGDGEPVAVIARVAWRREVAPPDGAVIAAG